MNRTIACIVYLLSASHSEISYKGYFLS